MYQIIILCAGVLSVGFGLGFIARGMMRKSSGYDGVITMTATEKGLLYSLELADDPAKLADQTEVIFRVNPPSDEKLLSR